MARNKIIEFNLRENEDSIQLTQLLKATNIAYSGADAGLLVLEGEVYLNNEQESRKRAKIKAGDVVRVFDKEIHIYR